MLVSQKRVLVASWPFMQNCCYCYIFDLRFRPHNLKGFFGHTFESHGQRLLVKEKNTRTSRDRPIARFFDPRDVRFVMIFSVTHTHTLNLTTVTCLENPAKAGIIGSSLPCTRTIYLPSTYRWIRWERTTCCENTG